MHRQPDTSTAPTALESVTFAGIYVEPSHFEQGFLELGNVVERIGGDEG